MKLLRNKWTWIITPIVLIAVGVGLYFYSKKPPEKLLEVPLGIEEAVIVTYSGVPIEPIPYKWGVAINVRIAGVEEIEGNRVYDIRYIVNRDGEYDLKDYFRGVDGKIAEGFPSFKFRGSNELSKNIETRIADTEKVRIALPSRYYETMTGLVIFWVLWLLALIFWPRHKKHVEEVVVRPSTLAQEIRAKLAMLESGSLDTVQQGQLELMIFRQWRDQQSLEGVRMTDLLAKFRADPEVSEAYTELENWLHASDRTAGAKSVAQSVRSQIRSAENQTNVQTIAP